MECWELVELCFCFTGCQRSFCTVACTGLGFSWAILLPELQTAKAMVVGGRQWYRSSRMAPLLYCQFLELQIFSGSGTVSSGRRPLHLECLHVFCCVLLVASVCDGMLILKMYQRLAEMIQSLGASRRISKLLWNCRGI